nr:hypothetical protein [Tanacetum cinerariifolium]
MVKIDSGLMCVWKDDDTSLDVTSSDEELTLMGDIPFSYSDSSNNYESDSYDYLSENSDIIVLSSDSEDINEGPSKGNVPKKDINEGPSKGKLPPLGSSARPRPEIWDEIVQKIKKRPPGNSADKVKGKVK